MSKNIISNKDLLRTINKRMGEGSIYSFEGDKTIKILPISTGIPSLDHALGIGGWPLGRLIELYGPESSGKTTLALKTIATFQQLSKQSCHPLYGKKAIFIDTEHALDPFHAKALNVDISEEGLLISQPGSGEEAYNLMRTLIKSGEVGLIVGDSLPAFTPQRVIDASAEDNHVGLHARLNSQMLPVIAKECSNYCCTVIMINQIREKVGVMYGNPETTPGGRALKFYSTVRAEVRRKEIKKGDVVIGQTMTVNLKKNKISRPFTKAEFDYYWDTGIDVIKDIMIVAMDMGIIKRTGAWYFYGEDSKNPLKDINGNVLKWMGKEAVEQALKQSPALFDYTNNIVLGKIPKDAAFVVEDDSQDGEYDEKESLEALDQ